MEYTLGIPRGFTGCLTRIGLGIGSTADELSIASDVGTGYDYAIDGIGYHGADDASTASIPAVLATQAADTTCLYLVEIGTTDAPTVKKGTEVLTADLVAGITAVHWPEPTAGKCPLGAFKVVTVAVTYIPGTTDLSTSGVTDTYYNFLGGMPTRPLTS